MAKPKSTIRIFTVNETVVETPSDSDTFYKVGNTIARQPGPQFFFHNHQLSTVIFDVTMGVSNLNVTKKLYFSMDLNIGIYLDIFQGTYIIAHLFAAVPYVTVDEGVS